MAATARAHSTRSAGVRRLLSEAAEMEADDSLDYTAAPLEDDLFTWHWTIRGAKGTDFEGGLYHGRIVLPPSYPFAPPEVYVATPSGRFEVNKKICLSISSFHPESWQPSWGVRTALLALVAFFDTEAQGAVGSLDAPPAERRRLAIASHAFECPTCAFTAKEFEQEVQAKIAQKEAERKEDEDKAGAEGGAQVALEKEDAPEEGESSGQESPVLAQERLPSRSRSHPRGPAAERQADPAGVSPPAIFRPHQPTLAPSPDGLANLPAGDPLPSPHPPATPRVAQPHTHNHPVGQQAGAPLPLVAVPTPIAPPQGAPAPLGVMLHPGLEGGSPLWIDRAIVVCLMGLLALIVRKVA